MSTVAISRKGIGGPRTPEGKARSSRNAVKHGLTSREPVLLAHESEEAWERFSRDFVESLHPEGAAELALAAEMALTLWRNRRAPVYQATMTSRALRKAERDHQFETRHLSPEARARQLELIRAETVLPAAPQLERLLKYEAQLDRKFDRLFRQFFKLLALREKATASSNLTPTPALTQQPTSPASETDKTNSSTIASPALRTSEVTSQTDKTNSPATTNPLPATSEITQTNKTNSPATSDAAPPTAQPVLQTDKTNSPSAHIDTQPSFPAFEAAPQINKTNSLPPMSPVTQRLPLPPPRKPTKRTPPRRRRP